jgi:hypothetical protein
MMVKLKLDDTKTVFVETFLNERRRNLKKLRNTIIFKVFVYHQKWVEVSCSVSFSSFCNSNDHCYLQPSKVQQKSRNQQKSTLQLTQKN